ILMPKLTNNNSSGSPAHKTRPFAIQRSMVNSFLTGFGDERISGLSEEVRMLSNIIAWRVTAAVASSIVLMAMAFAAAPAHADAGFQRWVQQFRSVANQNGISNST